MYKPISCISCIHYEVCCYAVHQLPVCDSYAEPLKHGHWIDDFIEREPIIENGRVYRPKTSVFKCSECKTEFAGVRYGFNYCPNCGSKMDGGAENGLQ